MCFETYKSIQQLCFLNVGKHINYITTIDRYISKPYSKTLIFSIELYDKPPWTNHHCDTYDDWPYFDKRIAKTACNLLRWDITAISNVWLIQTWYDVASICDVVLTYTHLTHSNRIPPHYLLTASHHCNFVTLIHYYALLINKLQTHLRTLKSILALFVLR